MSVIRLTAIALSLWSLQWRQSLEKLGLFHRMEIFQTIVEKGWKIQFPYNLENVFRGMELF